MEKGTGRLEDQDQKKNFNIKRQSSRTGGGPSSRVILTSLEEMVVPVIGASAVVGPAEIQEQGFHLENAMEVPMEPLNIVLKDHNSQNNIATAENITVSEIQNDDVILDCNKSSQPPLNQAKKAKTVKRAKIQPPQSASAVLMSKLLEAQNASK
ncbi:unnamed protein product [Euphydryas editha]|uniref:Uncharacterized protein n=1 Tax=Euphydryas editha TaxID=104508 RepID=A0AAU9UMH7_EUPED|nr:unnamed protein product [Euphydryas editha]